MSSKDRPPPVDHGSSAGTSGVARFLLKKGEGKPWLVIRLIPSHNSRRYAVGSILGIVGEDCPLSLLVVIKLEVVIAFFVRLAYFLMSLASQIIVSLMNMLTSTFLWRRRSCRSRSSSMREAQYHQRKGSSYGYPHDLIGSTSSRLE